MTDNNPSNPRVSPSHAREAAEVFDVVYGAVVRHLRNDPRDANYHRLHCSVPAAIAREVVAALSPPSPEGEHATCVHCGDLMGFGDDACFTCYGIAKAQRDILQEQLDAALAAARPSPEAEPSEREIQIRDEAFVEGAFYEQERQRAAQPQREDTP